MSTTQRASSSQTTKNASASQRRSAALATLKSYEAICTATVLEDCADQLAILGAIMPSSYESRKDASSLVKNEIENLVEEQQKLEGDYEHLMSARDQAQIGSATRQLNHQHAQQAGRELTNSTYVMGRSLKQNPLTMDNLGKIQEDRAFLEEIVISTIHELKEKSTFHSLIDAVKGEKARKQKLQETIKKEEEGRKYIKSLKDQLQNVSKEKEAEIQSRMEMIAHLKDQLQEMKAKTSMEKAYMKKVCMVSVNQTQKVCGTSEKELKDDIEGVKRKLDEEDRCHEEIVNYLNNHQSVLSEKLEYWMARYEKDTEEKTRDLDVLKSSKAKDLERLQELTKLYAEYEQVVVEDRIDKEKLRRKAEQGAIELKAAIRLQSWWRGIMVRKQLGPYKKSKKKKGKGKKSGKKKK